MVPRADPRRASSLLGIVRLPSWLTVSISALAGIVATVNVTSHPFSPRWSTAVTLGLTALATVGLGPLVHGRLAVVLHLPYRAALALGSGLGMATVGISTAAIDPALRGVLIGVLTALAGMLVGPAPPSSTG